MPTFLFNKSYNNSKNKPERPEDILNLISNGYDINEFLIILPTERQVYELRRQFIKKLYLGDEFQSKNQGKPIEAPGIINLSRLFKTLTKHLYEGNAPILVSNAFRRVLFEEAFEKCDLQYFKSKEGKISHSVLERVESIIMGIKKDGITTEKLLEDLREEDNGEITDRIKLSELQKIYQKYQELLENKNSDNDKIFIDEIEQQIKIINHPNVVVNYEIDEPFEEKSSNPFLDEALKGKKYILFYGFTGFTDYEIKILKLFATSAIPTLINIEYNPQNGPLFSNLEEPIINLTTVFNRKDINIVDESSHFSYLRQWLFNTRENKVNNNLKEKIRIFECKNRKEEVKTIAKYIKHIIATENYQPKDIAIAVQQPADYVTLFRERFYSDSIPFDVSDRFYLKTSPVTIAIFSVFKILLNGWRLDDVYNVMRNRYLTISDDEITIAPDNFYKVAMRLRIVGGFRQGGVEFYFKRMESILDYLQKKLTNTEDKIDIRVISNEIQETEKALADLKHLHGLLRKKSEIEMLPYNFQKLISKDIINKFKIAERFEKDLVIFNENREKNNEKDANFLQQYNDIEKDIKALNEFDKTLVELVNALSEKSHNKKYPLSELVQRLQIAIEASRYQIREKHDFGVTVTSIEQLRGMKFKAIILCGAVDGKFPVRYSADKMLGKKLIDSEQRNFEAERLLFYQFLTTNKKELDAKSEENKYKIIITYPTFDGDKDCVASSFINSLLNICVPKNQIFPTDEDLMQDPNFRFVETIDYNAPKNERHPWIFAITNKLEYISYITKSKNDISKKQVTEQRFIDYEEVSTVIRTNNLIKDRDNKNINDDENTPFFTESYLNERDKKVLERFEVSKRVYSISELETYASCPYKYYAERLLSVSDDDKDLEEDNLSPLEKGNMMHEILYIFFSEIQKQENEITWLPIHKKHPDLKNIKPVVLDPNNKEVYLKLLIEIAEQHFSKFHYDNIFMKMEIENIIGNEFKKGMLEKWLVGELERVASSEYFHPSAFEFGFGYSKEENGIPAIDINGINFKGKIDRVDFKSDGNSIQMLMGDYKSKLKNVSSNSDIKNGLSLQIPVYIMAIRDILRDYYNVDVEKIAGGVYYSLNPLSDEKKGMEYFKLIMFNPELKYCDSNYKPSKKEVLSATENIDDILEQTQEYVAQYAKNIENNEFTPNPSTNKSCTYCGLKSVCLYK